MSSMRSLLVRLWWPMAAFSLTLGLLALRASVSADAEALPSGYAARPFTFQLHMALGGMALALGPFQFLRSMLQGRRRSVHRVLGRMYVLACLISAGSAFVLAAHLSAFGVGTQVAFGLLAAAWVLTTVIAMVRIFQRKIAAHRAWMVRSFALTFAAVTLRAYLYLGEHALGLPYGDVYAASAWLCWIPNLVFAEWWIRGSSSRTP